ncbi:PAS domain S-box protein, partial [Phormidium sp. LEGE 05292]|uniref:PAS domain S-box protein n=1 Tax=[Phormidium] sp. LEGE 05292 TaxID=767427 RepID=UPI00187EAFE3
MFTHIKALDWLELKSVVVQSPLVVSPDTTILDAIRLMARYTIAQINSERSASAIESQVSEAHLEAQSSCVVVVENDLVVGIITTSDVKILRNQQQPLDRLLVRQVMTHPVIALREEAFTDLGSAINLLLEHDIDHLPILDRQDRLVGIVTSESLLPALNPLELYKQGQVLQQKLQSLEAENSILLESHTAELERGVEARTAALQTKREREKLVAQIAKRIRDSLKLQEILDVCVAEVRAFLECDRALIYQFLPDRSGIIIAESVIGGWSSTLGNHVQDCYCGQRIATYYNCEQPIVVNNIYTADYSDCHIQLLESYQIKANLIVPIWVAGQLWGLLVGHQCGEYRDWQQDDITLLQNISVQLAIAIHQATTHQQLQQELIERQVAEQRYASLTEAALVGIFRVDAEGNCIYVNNRYCEITGLTRETAFGKEWQKALHPEDRDLVMTECYQSVQENRPFQLEYRFLHPDGTVRWVYGQSVPERDTNGPIVGHVGNITDITECKRAETALKKAENQYREAQRIAHLGYWEYDLTTNTSSWSDEVFRIFGMERQTLAPNYLQFFNLVHPDDREMVKQSYIRHLYDGTPYNVVHRYLMPDGQLKYVQQECETIYAADGTPILSQGTVQDITSQQLAQVELERLNAKLEAIVAERTQKLWQVNNLQCAILNSTDYAIISTDLTGTIKTFNAGAERMLGYRAKEVVGKLNPSIFHDREELSQKAAVLSVELGQNIAPDLEVVVGKARQGIVNEAEWTHIRKDGSRFPVLLSITALKNVHREIIGFLGIAKDISEQKQSEIERQQLFQELSAFKLALDQSAIVSIVNTQGAIQYVNDRFCETFGYSCEQLIGQNHTIVASGCHSPSYIQELWDTITRGEIWRGEICYQAKNGSLYWFVSTIVPFLDEQGQPFQYLGIHFDITARKLVKAKLRQENSFRQQILENMAEGLCVCHDIAEFPFVRFTVWNPQMLAITGYSLEEINYLGWYQILYPNLEVQAQAIARMERMRQGDRLIAEEWEILRKDGYKRTIAISTSTLSSNDGQTHTLALIQDITDRIAAEKLLQNREARYHGLLEAASDAIMLTDEQGNLIEVNHKAEELLGYTPAELTSMHFTKLHRFEELPRLVTAFEELTDCKSRQVFDINFRCKDGHLVPADVSASLIEIQGEKIIQYIFRDITDRKRAEAALQASETRFRRVFDSNMIGMMFTDFSGVITEANDRFLEMLGYSREELEANQVNWAVMTPPEYHLSDLKVIEDLKRDGVLTPMEKAYYHKDGHQVPVIMGAALLDSEENGNCVALVLDISDRKRAEAALQESETRFRRVFESNIVGMIFTDFSGVITEANDRFLEMLGYSREDLKANLVNWATMTPPEYHQLDLDQMERLLRDRTLNPVEKAYYHKDGHQVPVLIGAALLDPEDNGSCVCVVLDISNLKRTEIALRESQQFLQTVLDSFPQAVFWKDRNSVFLGCNQVYAEVSGLASPSEVVGKTDFDFSFTEAEVTGFVADDRQVMESGVAKLGIEEVITLSTGEQRCLETNKIPLRDLAGNAIAVVGTFQDITERKLAELALAQYTSEIEDLYNNAPCGYHSLDPEGRFIRVNETELKLLGYSREEIIGNPVIHFFTEASREAFRKNFPVFQAQGWVKNMEFEMICKDGTILPVMISATAVNDSQGQYLYSRTTLVDIRDRKQAEQKIRALAEREALLREITQRIRRSLDLHTIFNTAVQEIRYFLRADRVTIFQFDPDSGCDDGEFVSESVSAGFMSVLEIKVHDHCFGERFAPLYQQGRFQAIDNIDNANLKDCHRAVLSQFQIRAQLILPLLKKDKLWGLLCIHQCSSPRQWQPTEISFTQEIANQLTIAIHQASLYERIQSELIIRKQAETALELQLQQQQTLGAITQQIRQSLNIEEILALVTQQVKDLLKTDRVIVFRLFPDGRSQIIAEAVDSEFVALKDRHWSNETWPQDILDCYWQGQPRIVPDVTNDTWTHCLVPYSLQGQIQSKIVAPILQEIHNSETHRWVAPRKNNKLWGILVVHACREKRVWQESEAQILQQIANQLAIAIQQANLFEQLQLELTSRQLAQQQLVQSNQQLAISNQELARATRLKDEFLANMSHELRTPLNSILGMTEGLQEQIFGSINEQQIRALKTIESSGSHLLELINDILDVAKIESGQLQLDCTPTSIASLCQSSLTFIKQLALKKHIQLEIKIPLHLPDLLLDERRIRQVLINLLNNAVKFTPEGGHITLEVSLMTQQGDGERRD